MTKFLIDCENTMTMCAVNKLKGHTGRAFLGILHTASRAEAAFAAEGNKFHVVQLRCNFLCYFFFLKADVDFIVVFIGEGAEISA